MNLEALPVQRLTAFSMEWHESARRRFYHEIRASFAPNGLGVSGRCAPMPLPLVAGHACLEAGRGHLADGGMAAGGLGGKPSSTPCANRKYYRGAYTREARCTAVHPGAQTAPR